MQNIEFKAELRDAGVARAALRKAGASRGGVVEQADTDYSVPTGRLKRREARVDGRSEPVELIEYERAERATPKISTFTIYSEAEARERFGERDLPVWVEVRKAREIWDYRGVRVHLDEVEGLGSFVEFEALVTPKRNVARCRELLDELRALMGPALGEAVSAGYADLLGGTRESA